MLQQKDNLTQRWEYWQTGKYLPELQQVHLFSRYSVLYKGKPSWSNTPATLYLLLQQKPDAAWKTWMSTFQKLKENWFWIKIINWFPSWPSWELNLSTQLSCIKIFSEAVKSLLFITASHHNKHPAPIYYKLKGWQILQCKLNSLSTLGI